MPNASVRRVGTTTRAAMLAVTPDDVQDSAVPISTPAPSVTITALCAVAVRSKPAMYRTLPATPTQRVP